MRGLSSISFLPPSHAAGEQMKLIRALFLRQAQSVRISSPTFSSLLEASADCNTILDLATAVRPGNLVGLFTLMVIRYVAYKHQDIAIAGLLEPGHPAEPARRIEVIAKFGENHREEIRDLLCTRNMNTSIVARASAVLPAMSEIARIFDDKFDLIEIGCGAGFNLSFDAYTYEYGPIIFEGEDAETRIRCTSIGDDLPCLPRTIEIGARVGIDRDHLVTDDAEADRRWLDAMLFPEMTDERNQLQPALARSRYAYPIHIGDGLSLLPRMLDQMGPKVCVLHSHCMGQWDEAYREEFRRLLISASTARDIDLIGIEPLAFSPTESARRLLAQMAIAAQARGGRSFPCTVSRTAYRAGRLETQEIWAYTDGFGGWIAWGVA